jgi:hypothetical protein
MNGLAVWSVALAAVLMAGCAAKSSEPTSSSVVRTTTSSSVLPTTEGPVPTSTTTTVPTPTTVALMTKSVPRLMLVDNAFRGTVRDRGLAGLLSPSIESFRPGSTMSLLAAPGSSLTVQLDDQDLLAQPGQASAGRTPVTLPESLSDGIHWVAIHVETPNGPRSVGGHILQGNATPVQAPIPRQLASVFLPGDVASFLPRASDQGYFDELFDLIDGEDGIGIYNRVTRVARYVRSDGSPLPGPELLPMDFTPLGYSHGSVLGYRSDGTTSAIGPDGTESPSKTPTIDLDVQRFASLLGAAQVFDSATASQLIRSPYDALWYQFDQASGGLRLSMQSSHMFLPFGGGGMVEFQRPDGIARRVDIPNESRLAVLDRACSPAAPGHCVAVVQGAGPILTAVGVTADGELGFVSTIATTPTYLQGRRYIAFQGGRAVAVVPSGDHVLIAALE